MSEKSQYICNLTDNLIGKNRLASLWEQVPEADFMYYARIDLEQGDVRKMRFDTLGKIMCSFEIGDVLASKQELFDNITFSGDCEELLRGLVSVCLTYVIRDRLNPEAEGSIPKYKRPNKVVVE